MAALARAVATSDGAMADARSATDRRDVAAAATAIAPAPRARARADLARATSARAIALLVAGGATASADAATATWMIAVIHKRKPVAATYMARIGRGMGPFQLLPRA